MQQCCRAGSDPLQPPPKRSEEEDDDNFEGLTPEEDWEVPGNPMSALSQNTEIGRAVSDACDEMGELGSLEADVLQKANDVLKKHGYKSNLEVVPPKDSSNQRSNGSS